MDSILKYHIQETKAQFTDIRRELVKISDKLNEINEFKVSTAVTARFVSFIVSGVCGLITLTVSTLVAYYSLKK